jgi:hypothetical protein
MVTEDLIAERVAIGFTPRSPPGPAPAVPATWWMFGTIVADDEDHAEDRLTVPRRIS